MSYELARWSCPRCRTTIDVWLEDGQPEDLTATRCPVCVERDRAGRPHPVFCQPNPEATALWEATPVDGSWESPS